MTISSNKLPQQQDIEGVVKEIHALIHYTRQCPFLPINIEFLRAVLFFISG